ncbi:hypothetical protein OG205_09425 [Lentzea sp. NBC_00516]|uniref:hypothetical protein n=1 Tax=Lentzea sp. NBC_00516 TaxID=2903582 RepID=UPI002E81EA0A|nr:hypothetical protein [Lentzea sp. NBC_00516]WUD27194.1 hypothetical protein OG205_09425 [Lentzea sp. NBC_00516]
MLSLETPGIGARVKTADYGFWQQLLAETFLSRPMVPVVLFIDDDELARIAPAELHPAASLAAAVGELLFLSGGRNTFGRVRHMQKVWQQGDQTLPPPTLPVLALSVLAASRMHRDSEVAANNFYTRLAQALVPHADQEVTANVRAALREAGAFADVADMWRVLDRWLKSLGGARGVSTIRDHPGLTRIGYPLSQAVLRSSDRARLTRFFAKLDVRTVGVPSASVLLSYLKMWMSAPRGLSPAFQQLVSDPLQVELVGQLLVGLAEDWDGRVITADGLRRLDMKVALDVKRQRVSWVITAADGVDEDVLRGEIAAEQCEVAIFRDPYSSLYALDRDLPATTQDLTRGLRLVGQQCSARFSPADVVVFAEDPDAGCWLSCPSINPHEEHLIAARDDVVAALERVFVEAAEPGWRRVGRVGASQLLPGWKLYRSVVFADAGRLDAALSRTPVLRMSPVRPDLVVRPQLTNGLRLARHVTRFAYLSGGEPDLLLPSGQQARTVEAALDGVAQQPSFVASGFPISLRRIGPLTAGRHELRVDGEVLVFHVIDAEPRGGGLNRGELGWNSNAFLCDDEDRVEICGADVHGPPDNEPVLARRGQDETWLLREDGICSQIEEPEPAEVLARVCGVTPYYFEVTATPSAAWLAQRRGNAWQVRLLQPNLPAFGYLDAVSASLWARISGHGQSTEPLWAKYLQQWERHCGR